MQGSGTFGDEAVLTSVVGDDEKVLICSNGAYGDRMVEVCRHARVPHAVYSGPYSDIPHVERIREMLDADPAITHVCMVHSETTTGLLNDIAPVGELCHERGLTFIVDAMSSFACVEMPMEDWHIDFLVSSANRGIQDVPGLSFIICRRDKLEASAGKARSLSMDLYDQWVPMERDGKWRYTSPTHVVLAFAKALRELEEKGGIPARAARYAANQRLLTRRMEAMVFKAYLDHHQGPIITPDAVGGHGRPYPYMMLRNMEALGVTDARRAAKAGDTVSDIREGKNAGCISIGVIEVFSEMAMAQDESEALGTDEQAAARERVGSVFRAAGADAVIDTFAELPALLRQL